jgi:hypothetical protein
MDVPLASSGPRAAVSQSLLLLQSAYIHSRGLIKWREFLDVFNVAIC